MITVKQAEEIILNNTIDLGAEIVMFDEALGRVLAETIKADRDLPPFNRVTMDGIAIIYQAITDGITTFNIKGTQAAGDRPIEITATNECVEIMTGAALPGSTDTVIRYEDLEIKDGKATLLTRDVKQGQSLHLKGADKKQGDVLLTPGQLITPAVISLAASIGETELRVKRKPRVAVISTGDELVDVNVVPSPYKIRRSNGYMVKAMLEQQGLQAINMHIPDEPLAIKQQLQLCLQNFDAIIISGGISMGKFDHIPQALHDLQVDQLFHKVQQRPGKPFWFGRHQNGVVVFAFPGNPVATFLGTQRYFIPWLQASLGLSPKRKVYAVLANDLDFQPQLQYFLQVKLSFNDEGKLLATPIEGNGSGDHANLVDADAFMELPLEKNEFKKGEVYPLWQFNYL